MSETVKLIIEIPRNEYEQTCNLTLHDRSIWDNAIRNGTPLSEVLDEIKKEIIWMEYRMIDCEVFLNQDEVLDIIDKHISEEGNKE